MIVTNASGVAVEFTRVGTGPPVILIAPNFSAQESGYLDGLAPRFTAIEVSPRGYRGSSWPSEDEPVRLEHLPEDIESAADACGVSTFAVWGYSLSAGMALYVAATSTRVNAVIAGGFPTLTPLAYQVTAAYFRNLWASGPADQDLPFHPATAVGFYEAMGAWLSEADLSKLPERRIAYYGSKDQVFGMLGGPESHEELLRNHGFTLHAFDGLDHDECGARAEIVIPTVSEMLTK